jgi:hypothetical protein
MSTTSNDNKCLAEDFIKFLSTIVLIPRSNHSHRPADRSKPNKFQWPMAPARRSRDRRLCRLRFNLSQYCGSLIELNASIKGVVIDTLVLGLRHSPLFWRLIAPMLGLSIHQTSLTSSSLISGIVLSSIAEKIRTCIPEKRLCQKCLCLSMSC